MPEEESRSPCVRLRRRLRRLRKNAGVRSLCRESGSLLSTDHFVWPVFICDGIEIERPIPALYGQCTRSIDKTIEAVGYAYLALGIPAVALFPAVEDALKDTEATEALNPEGLVPRCVRELKTAYPDLIVITDIALDPFSADGHDGIVNTSGEIDNDLSLEKLAQMAVVHAQAGADIVAPSDMMDGRVDKIRDALDGHGFSNTLVLAYTAKYCSAFYGPFRVALDSAPRSRENVPHDKKTYQMDPANARQAIDELQLDLEEGADIVMVKPALHYLDIISRFRESCNVPIAAYHVSGEYAMLRAAADAGLVDWKRGLIESLMCIRRAGADIIFTYAACEVGQWLLDREIEL